MTCYRTTVFRIAALMAVFACCCGFSWGLGKSDPCVESRTTLDTLSTISDPIKRAKLEETILKACPNGAAGLFIKALQAEKASKPDAAMALYREALAKDTTIAEAHGNLGLLLSEHGLKQEATVELTKGLIGRPDPRYHRAIANIMGNVSLPALALFHYDEALKAFPDEVEIHTGRAEAYVQLGQFDMAEEEYVRLKTFKPTDVKFQLGLAEVYRKAGRLDRAIEELKSYLHNNPADKDGHRLLAEVLMEKGERETARKEFLLAGVDVSINPDDFARKGDEFMKSREFGQAISAYQTALNGRPTWHEIEYKLGKAQMSAGRDDDAMATLTALIKAGFKGGSAFYDLGLLHERGGKLEEAISAYRLSIIHEPSNVNAHRRLAEIFTWRGSFSEAADQYRELIHLRGDNPLYHLNLGRVYDQMKDLKNAVSEYETVIRLDPNNLEGHRELARIFLRGAQPAKAEQHYKEVLRLNSEDETAHNALITLYVKQKRYDDLTTFVKNWLEKSPDDPQRHYRLGIVYEIKKEYDLAVTKYRKAIELQPGNAKMLLALGRTYMKSGRISESREILEAASKADPTLAEPQLLLNSIKSNSEHQKKNMRKRGKRVWKKQTSRKKVTSVHPETLVLTRQGLNCRGVIPRWLSDTAFFSFSIRSFSIQGTVLPCPC
jgi:tetratricopeptide (TPR) repeat protein